jgi:hypothetical protein
VGLVGIVTDWENSPPSDAAKVRIRARQENNGLGFAIGVWMGQVLSTIGLVPNGTVVQVPDKGLVKSPFVTTFMPWARPETAPAVSNIAVAAMERSIRFIVMSFLSFWLELLVIRK